MEKSIDFFISSRYYNIAKKLKRGQKNDGTAVRRKKM
jgi:hypothetical protein